ncbi:unnamed protein product [Cyclocybe aegerita]|uniref:Uncharacterized protein n=1 Tax=Cyclocybe aegerita TaxID=1973307 RepID=A0A8S0XE98_CYCAE|nr:unnamed protein product [Cyclocybe aegerita]
MSSRRRFHIHVPFVMAASTTSSLPLEIMEPTTSGSASVPTPSQLLVSPSSSSSPVRSMLGSSIAPSTPSEVPLSSSITPPKSSSTPTPMATHTPSHTPTPSAAPMSIKDGISVISPSSASYDPGFDYGSDLDFVLDEEEAGFGSGQGMAGGREGMERRDQRIERWLVQQCRFFGAEESLEMGTGLGDKGKGKRREDNASRSRGGEWVGRRRRRTYRARGEG